MPIFIQSRIPRLVIATAVIVTCACGDEAGWRGSLVSWLEHRPELGWLEVNDSMQVTRRLRSGFEYEDHESGDASAKWLLNLRWSEALNDDFVLALQLEAPLRWESVSDVEDTGTGDIELRAGFLAQSSDRLRWGMGLNAKLPTAPGGSPEDFGDGVFELRPIVAVRWAATQRIKLGANLEYSFTPRDEGDDRVSNVEVKLPVVFKLTDQLSAFSSYNPRWNDVRSDWRHRMELGLTRQFGVSNQYAVTLGAEIPLKNESLDWKAVLDFSWLF